MHFYVSRLRILHPQYTPFPLKETNEQTNKQHLEDLNLKE